MWPAELFLSEASPSQRWNYHERDKNMRHQDLTINHRLESWVYANAAARTSATGFVAGDVGRIAFQTDTGQYWRLLTTAPTWQLISPPVVPPVYARLQTGQVTSSTTPTVTALAPGVMLGVGNTITPTATGKILVTIAGTVVNQVANASPICQMRWGTGTPPAFGASGNSGTLIGGVAGLTGNIGNNASPFALSGVITGATLGVPIWFDLQLYNLGAPFPAGQAYVNGVSVTAVELP
jgi:hypothetical protein